MWQTFRFCNSHAYISRVHGLLNDSASTRSTPSRSASPASGSIRNDTLPTWSGITGDLGVSSAHVERTNSVGRWTMAGEDGVTGDLRDRSRQERRYRVCHDREISKSFRDQQLERSGTVADKEHPLALPVAFEHGRGMLNGRRLDLPALLVHCCV